MLQVRFDLRTWKEKEELWTKVYELKNMLIRSRHSLVSAEVKDLKTGEIILLVKENEEIVIYKYSNNRKKVISKLDLNEPQIF